MIKITVITGSRAEYGLLHWLMKDIEKKEGLELKVVVTGMHLSPEFGMTVNEIEKDFDPQLSGGWFVEFSFNPANNIDTKIYRAN